MLGWFSIIVHEDVHDELVEAIKLRFPSGLLALAWKRELEWEVWFTLTERCLDMLSKGLEQGGEIACGGNALDRDGAFMEATVVTGVSPDNLLFQEEVRPVLSQLSLAKIRSTCLANDTPFGLLNESGQMTCLVLTSSQEMLNLEW